MKITRKQRKALAENPNVLKITDSQVMFKPEFKIKAVEANLNGEPPGLIFGRHGIDPELFPEGYYRHCLKRWRSKYADKGKDSLKTNDRGKNASGRPKESLDGLSMDDLRAIIFVQQDIIAEIKKRKALIKKN